VFRLTYKNSHHQTAVYERKSTHVLHYLVVVLYAFSSQLLCHKYT